MLPLNFEIGRHVLRLFGATRFTKNITSWYYVTLIRFLEVCSGKGVFLKLNPFLEQSLSFRELAYTLL